MLMLPKRSDQFSQADYWENFFKKRGKNAFEWYGEYEELCGILHKYIKSPDTILVTGCGNSAVSSNLYDIGYRNITNIDISDVVIKQMQRKYAKSRPGLIYRKMDALHTDFSASHFSVVFDKGTMDALFPDNSLDSRERVMKMFDEIDRILRVGGRYICISLLQTFILSFMVDYFFNKGWMLRVCRCLDLEKNHSSEFHMPVFAVICTKMKKLHNFQPVIEISMDNNHVARTNKDELIQTIQSIQQAETVCYNLSKSCLNDDVHEVTIEISRPNETNIRYSVVVVDSDTPVNANEMKFCAFVVPAGKNNEWLFSSVEGRQVLRQNCHVDRVAVILLHDNQEYSDLKAIQEELSDTVIKLAPKGIVKRGEKVTFLTMAVNTTDCRKTVVKGESSFSGAFLVEDVTENNEIYRRLVFLKKGNVIQSEIKLKSSNNGDEKEQVDFNYVSCEYHILISIGLSIAVSKTVKCKYDVLLLGLGGGVLATLIHKLFEKIFITGVEIDEEIYKIARQHFYLKDDERIKVEIEDGLKFLSTARENATKYDAIILDVDNKDPKLGISCPPVSFLEENVLQNAVHSLHENGLFLLNLVCRSAELKKEIFQKLDTVFAGYVALKTKEDVNEIVICWKTSLNIHEADVHKAAEELRAISTKCDIVWPNDILTISDCIQNTKYSDLTLA